ncbi:MAG TPA: hypothetical protein VLA43_18650 [Longimicrobiales bacterium]|nr:hypothetical protein [Longimicrobiales bacterium]
MRTLFSTLLALGILAGGALAASPQAASASCTKEYYVCLNDNVYPEDGLKRELEAIECGLGFWGCLVKAL